MSTTNEKTNGDSGFTSALPGVGLADLLNLANRRRGIMLGCFGAGLAIAIVVYLLATPKYESSAQILVMKKDSKLAARGVEGTNESDSRVSEDLLATHMQIVQSRQIVEQALKQHHYDQLPSIVDNLDSDEDAVAFVIERLYVTRGGTGQAKTAHVLNIKFEHTSPEECQKILEVIVVSYKSFLGEKFQDVSKEAARLITEAKVDLASDLEKAETEYQRFREQAPLLWKGDESANIHRVRYEELEAALSEIRLKTTEAKARLEVVTKAAKEQDTRNASDLERLALLDDEHIERVSLLVDVDKGDANTAEFQATQPGRMEGAKAEHEALLTLMLKERTLRQELGPDHPQLQDIGRQISMIRTFLQEKSASLGSMETKLKLTPKNLLAAYIGLLGHDLLTLQKRQEELASLAKTEEEAAKALVSYELKGETLRKDLARKQDLYDAVLERLREINLVKEYGGFVTEVIAPCELGEKFSPKLSIILCLGAFVGLVVGAGAAGLSEYTDPLFLGALDVSRTLSLPVLSQLPKLGQKLDSHLPLTADQAKVAPTLVAFHRPRSRESEIIRGLRTALSFSINGAKHQVLAFTSANPGDGKTTVATNTAVSMAQAGHKVLLIDCDMRRPNIHKILGLTPTVGLSSVLTGACEPADAIVPSGVPNLEVLPCGPLPTNPAELLMAERFVELIALLRDRYDYVLLDSPPLLAVADPCIVAPHADGIVVTVRLSKDSRSQVLRSKELLEASHAKLLGIVINGHDIYRRQQVAGYEYGYGYASAYGYGYGYKSADKADSYYGEDQDEMAADGSSRTGHTNGTFPR